MDSNPIHHLSSAKKLKYSFLDYVQLLMISWAGQWNQILYTTCLQPKNEMLIFGLYSTSDYQPGWSMNSNPISHLSPAKKWNAHFWITFNYWWSATEVDGLEPNLPSLSSQNNEMLVFGLHSTSYDWPGRLMDSNPIRHHSPDKKKWKAHFWITFNFWRLVRQVDQFKPYLPALSSQKMKFSFLDFIQLLVISRVGRWTETPSTTPLQKTMKCLFLDYIQLLMFSQAGQWTRAPSDTPLQPKTWNAHFWITFNIWWLAGLFNGLKPHPPPLFSQKNEMLLFGFHSTSDDWPGRSMDWNPICHQSMNSNNIYHLSPAKRMKYSFLDYIQLLMIGRAGWWIQTPSDTPLQPKKWNAHFWITFNFSWSTGMVNGFE